MKSFSQRAGLKPVPQVAQIGAMSDELRASLSALKAGFTSTYGYTNEMTGYAFSCTSFINYLKASIAR